MAVSFMGRRGVGEEEKVEEEPAGRSGNGGVSLNQLERYNVVGGRGGPITQGRSGGAVLATTTRCPSLSGVGKGCGLRGAVWVGWGPGRGVSRMKA